MIYEWDEKKRLSNIKKHGFDFADAYVVFKDEQAIQIADKRKDYGELRIKTIGKYHKEIIVVIIHTGRKKAVRIISFRRANKKEREAYYYGNSQIYN
jgi:uncharacterized DUF497 family protein